MVEKTSGETFWGTSRRGSPQQPLGDCTRPQTRQHGQVKTRGKGGHVEENDRRPNGWKSTLGRPEGGSPRCWGPDAPWKHGRIGAVRGEAHAWPKRFCGRKRGKHAHGAVIRTGGDTPDPVRRFEVWSDPRRAGARTQSARREALLRHNFVETDHRLILVTVPVPPLGRRARRGVRGTMEIIFPTHPPFEDTESQRGGDVTRLLRWKDDLPAPVAGSS